MQPVGVVIRKSSYSVTESIDLLQRFLIRNGATIYTRIDQQKEVKKVGQSLPPLQFILFGNPKSGGPLMSENPLIALDLPLKVIAWEDKNRNVWLAYNEGSYVEKRYSFRSYLNSPLSLDKMMENIFG